MKEITRYAYEKRIKELEKEVADLTQYKYLALQIFDTVQSLISESKQINMGWLVRQFKMVFK